MVKCPRGTFAQRRANFAYIKKTEATDRNLYSWISGIQSGEMPQNMGEPPQSVTQSSSAADIDSVKADKRSAPTPKDDLIYLFISFFLDILLKSWKGNVCLKPKLADFSTNKLEELGEAEGEFIPCESSVSSAADVKSVYQKISTNLTHEKYSRIENAKKSSETSEEEFLNEEDFEEMTLPDSFGGFVPDEDVHFEFVNGVWYKGRVSRRLPEGEGIYFWEDGALFKGEFEGGSIIGKGRLEFPDLSVYEGFIYKAFRHGEGMFYFSESPVMYTGQWWLGKKHGQGLIIYKDPSKELNFYRGQWENGVKEGFGYRQYPSGAKYIGFWSKGKRHGRGVMLWSNNDIYRGQWKEGEIHGYGEYTWNGFINKTLSYPCSNIYRGYWSQGKRNGQGIFEIKNGTFIETSWENDLKEGPGAVVCRNGTVVAAERLFVKDKQALFSDQLDNIGLLLRDQASVKNLPRKRNKMEERLLALLGNVERPKAIPIPIHSSVTTLNLCPHTQKYYTKQKEKLLQEKDKKNSDFEMIRMKTRIVRQNEGYVKEIEIKENTLTDEDHCQLSMCVLLEEKHLRNAILAKINQLRSCYSYYSTLACTKIPSFKCVLLRLFLWQLFLDGDIPDTNFSLVDINNLLAQEEYLLIDIPHDPFERIYFWQFVHVLIALSWHLYGRHYFEEVRLTENKYIEEFIEYFRNVESKHLLKAAFEFFLEKDVFQGRFGVDFDPNKNRSNNFQEADFAPMEAMYLVYRQVGEPHSARELVDAMCLKRSERPPVPDIVRYFEKLPFFKLKGKNALAIAGEFAYIPENKPLNFPEILELEEVNYVKDVKSNFTCFNNLTAKQVVSCLVKVCPGIMNKNVIVRMDYQLTFLEFYKVLILCTELTLKLKAMKEMRGKIIEKYKAELEEYNNLVSQQDKAKESKNISRKKSRLAQETSKKGKK